MAMNAMIKAQAVRSCGWFRKLFLLNFKYMGRKVCMEERAMANNTVGPFLLLIE